MPLSTGRPNPRKRPTTIMNDPAGASRPHTPPPPSPSTCEQCHGERVVPSNGPSSWVVCHLCQGHQTRRTPPPSPSPSDSITIPPDSCITCTHFKTRYDNGEANSYFPTGYGRCDHLHIFAMATFGCRAHEELVDLEQMEHVMVQPVTLNTVTEIAKHYYERTDDI